MSKPFEQTIQKYFNKNVEHDIAELLLVQEGVGELNRSKL